MGVGRPDLARVRPRLALPPTPPLGSGDTKASSSSGSSPVADTTVLASPPPASTLSPNRPTTAASVRGRRSTTTLRSAPSAPWWGSVWSSPGTITTRSSFGRCPAPSRTRSRSIRPSGCSRGSGSGGSRWSSTGALSQERMSLRWWARATTCSGWSEGKARRPERSPPAGRRWNSNGRSSWWPGPTGMRRLSGASWVRSSASQRSGL